MFERYTNIINKFIPEANKKNIDLYYQSFLLVNAYIFSTVFLLLFITMHYIKGNYLEVYILGVNAVLFPVMFLFYPRSGNNVFFGNAIVGAGFLGFLVIAYVDGGIYAPVIPWFTAVSVTGFLFANKQSGIFWTTMAILTILTYFILELAGFHFPSYFPPENRLMKLGTSYLGSSIYLIITVFSYEYLNNKKNKQLNRLLKSNTEKQEEIKLQRDKLQEIYNVVDKSIDYATRIQQSILSSPQILEKSFSDNFIFFKPKDKVSGDFYWWAIVENQLVMTVADCTGHGVPGAFMSLLGISYLREIVQKGYITHTGVILKKLRKEVIKSLKQTGEKGSQKDGMDMAIVSLDLKTNKLQFSGANNSLYIITDSKLQILDTKNDNLIKQHDDPALNTQHSKSLFELKPDKMPIGIYTKMDNFTTHDIQLQKGDILYLFSDGFSDQFGGKSNKKFKHKAFKNVLLKNADKPMPEQKAILEKTLNDWQHDNEQVDDITVLGFVL